MIVTHIHIVGVVIIAPNKTYTVLMIDPDTELAFPVAFGRFESVTRRKPKIIQNLGGIDYFQFTTSSPFYFPETLHRLTIEKALSVLVSNRLDHGVVYSATRHKDKK